MGFGVIPGQSPLSYAGIKETNPPQIFTVARAPTSDDYRKPNVGDVWINSATNEIYMCAAINGAVATWVLAAGTANNINTINGDSGSTNGPAVTFTGNNGLECNVSGTTATYQFTPVASGFSNSQREFKQSGLQTTDAVARAVASITVTSNETISVNARLSAMRDDFSAALVGEIFYGARRAGGGAVEISPPIVNILEDSASAPVIDADVNGNDIRLLVTGVAGQTWNWVVSYDYHAVRTNV